MKSPGRILRLAAVELSKARRQRLTHAVVGVPVFTAALVPQGLWLAETQGMQGYRALSLGIGFGLLLGSFLLLLHASLSISWERTEKTLRDVLAGPVRRWEVIASRWVVLVALLLLLVGCVAVAALLSTWTHYPLDDIRGEAVEPLFYAHELRHHTLLGILYFLPAGLALVTLGLFISVLCSTPAVSVAAALGLLLFLDIAKSVLSSKEAIVRALFNAYLPTLFDQTSYLHGVMKLAEGIGDVLWTDDSAWHSLVFAVPAAYAVALLAGSLWIFTRRDFAE